VSHITQDGQCQFLEGSFGPHDVLQERYEPVQRRVLLSRPAEAAEVEENVQDVVRYLFELGKIHARTEQVCQNFNGVRILESVMRRV
jgi:hypothetical protein